MRGALPIGTALSGSHGIPILSQSLGPPGWIIAAASRDDPLFYVTLGCPVLVWPCPAAARINFPVARTLRSAHFRLILLTSDVESKTDTKCRLPILTMSPVRSDELVAASEVRAHIEDTRPSTGCKALKQNLFVILRALCRSCAGTQLV